MHFSLAAGLAVVLLVASTAHTTHTTIPLSRRTNVYRSDGSVDLEELKRETDHSTAKILRGLLNYERNTGKRHPLSLGVRDFKRAIVSNPLTDVDGQIWFGTVYVGTPSVAFTINFDTGSSDFVIPGLACDWQGTKYNPAASATSVALGQNFEVEFGDGSEASGSLYNDTVTIVGLAATRQTFGSASIFGRDFRDTEDGIMGMAFRSLSEYNANPVFQNLVDQGQTTLPYFAMKLTAGNSELDIGGLVSVLYTGPITWVPVLNQEYWEVRFDSLKIGGEVLVAASPCIIDSGTNIIIGELDEVEDLYNLIPGSRSEDDGLFSFPCNEVLPDISFYFGGQQFSMTRSFNFGPIFAGANRCAGGIRGREDVEFWTLGGTFMTNYYTIFDIGQPGVRGAQVGFADLA